MKPDRTTRRVILVSIVPLALATIIALTAVLTENNWTFRITTPLSSVLLVAGGAVSLVTAGAFWGRRALHKQYRRGHAAATDEAREAHRRFIARLDHELKNPVTAIRAALEAHGDPSPALLVAVGQADRLASLIEELRSLSALETTEIERGPVDTASLVSDEVTAFMEDLHSRGDDRQVRLHLPSAPWPLPQVAGDADLIAVALRNLLVNAAKYSDPESCIEIRGSEESGHVLLEVADTGWGVAPEELSLVWDELWRGSAARRVEGTGLGLSLVQLVARRHGGEATLRSLPGKGTSVRIRLPALLPLDPKPDPSVLLEIGGQPNPG